MDFGYIAAQLAYDRQLPPEFETGRFPVCPVCGKEADAFYKRKGEVVGCDDCTRRVDAWECEQC